MGAQQLEMVHYDLGGGGMRDGSLQGALKQVLLAYSCVNRGVVWKDQGVHSALPALPPCTPLVGLSGGLETWMGLWYMRLRALASRVRFCLSWNISYKLHFVRSTRAVLQLLGGKITAG